VGLGVLLEGELADEADVLLDEFALLFHFADVVLAALALQPLHELLVLLDDLEQLALAVGLVEGLLLLLA